MNTALETQLAGRNPSMRLSERLLSRFCKDPQAVPYCDPASPEDIANRIAPEQPLRELLRAFPSLPELICGKTVLDFGCGWGDQSAAMAELGAIVTGFDTHAGLLAAARARYPGVRYLERIDGERFDVIVTQDAMEHFNDPRAALGLMVSALKPGGPILMTFGPPWFAPYGTHMDFFCKLPWLQLLFPEKTVMGVRERYRQDGAQHYEEVESGLNRMSLRKFERLIRESGLTMKRRDYIGVKKLHTLTKIPMVRELTTVAVVAVLIH